MAHSLCALLSLTLWTATSSMVARRGARKLDGAEASPDLQLLQSVESHVRAYFDILETELPAVDYSKVPDCGPDWLSYVNLVVHVRGGRWSVVCGNITAPELAGRGPSVAAILDRVVPELDPAVDVHLPFGLHDGVSNVHAANPQHPPNQLVPVLGSVFTPSPPGGSAALPFAMGCDRSSNLEFMNTPVVGWDAHVKRWYSCSSNEPSIRKVVFRGKAGDRKTKYGACTNACSWKDNGRLLVHNLGLSKPDKFDAGVSNAESYGLRHGATNLPFPEQLCNYTAVLNIGNNMDWAERLRQSFYGNAVLLLPGPENMPHEFFTSFMVPYTHYWPMKSDLSDMEQQVDAILEAARVSDQSITRVLAGQKQFREQYLTEAFMLMYDKVVIEEFHRRRVSFRMSPEQFMSNATTQADAARSLLNARACTPYKTDCGSLPGPALKLWEA